MGTTNAPVAKKAQGRCTVTIRLRRGETYVNLLESIASNIALTQTHHDFSGMSGNLTGTENQILNDGAKTSTLHAPLFGWTML